MIRTTLISIASAVALSGCALGDIPLGERQRPPTPAPLPLVGACEALRPALPIKYKGGPDSRGGRPGEDTASTVYQARDANARFAAACP